MKSNDIKILDNGWMEVPFSYMAEHISKRVDPKDTDLDIYIGLEHLDPGSLKIKSYGKPEDVKGTKLIAQPGDIIFGKRRAYQGKVGVCEWDAIVSAHSMVLRPREENIEKDFLKFFMQSEEFYNRSIQISEGSLSPTIKWKVLADQKFIIPTKESQIKIIKNIEGIEKLNQSHEILLEKLLLYKEKLINCISQTSTSNGASYIDLGKMKLKTTPLCLNKNSNILTGFAFKSRLFNEEVGIPLIRIRDFETHSPNTLYAGEYDSKYIVEKDDFLISMDGEFNIIRWKGTKSLLNQRVIKIKSCNEEILDSEFLYHAISKKLKSIEDRTKGTTVKHLSKSDIEKIVINIPDIKQQRKISQILNSTDDSIESVKGTINDNINLKRKLLNCMFNYTEK